MAAAAPKESPTQIEVVTSGSQSLSGLVTSKAKKCVRARTVQLYPAGSDVPFLTTTTSRTGSFSVAVGDIPSESEGFQIRAEPVRIGNRQCQAGSFDVAADFVTLSGGAHDGAFTGVLFSSVEACEPNRLILLYEISSGEPTFSGSDNADSNGAWMVAQASGVWQAAADAKFVSVDGTVTLCRAVASQPWTFEETPPEE